MVAGGAGGGADGENEDVVARVGTRMLKARRGLESAGPVAGGCPELESEMRRRRHRAESGSPGISRFRECSVSVERERRFLAVGFGSGTRQWLGFN